MKWIFMALGFITGYFGAVNLLVALIHHLPYACRLSKTHNVMKAQRADGKLDIWYGPVPYGRIFLGPAIFTVIFITIWIVIAIFLPAHVRSFGIGVAVAMVIDILGLYDPKGRFKRDMNLTVGDNWSSQTLVDGFGTLQDEQRLRDIPEHVNRARDFLVSNEGEHEDSSETQAALATLIRYDKPRLDGQEQLITGTAVSRFEFRKALLNYSLYKDRNGKVTHHFSSTTGSLKIENS